VAIVVVVVKLGRGHFLTGLSNIETRSCSELRRNKKDDEVVTAMGGALAVLWQDESGISSLYVKSVVEKLVSLMVLSRISSSSIFFFLSFSEVCRIFVGCFQMESIFSVFSEVLLSPTTFLNPEKREVSGFSPCFAIVVVAAAIGIVVVELRRGKGGGMFGFSYRLFLEVLVSLTLARRRGFACSCPFVVIGLATLKWEDELVVATFLAGSLLTSKIAFLAFIVVVLLEILSIMVEFLWYQIHSRTDKSSDEPGGEEK